MNKEQKRLKVITEVEVGRMTARETTEKLGLSSSPRSWSHNTLCACRAPQCGGRVVQLVRAVYGSGGGASS